MAEDPTATRRSDSGEGPTGYVRLDRVLKEAQARLNAQLLADAASVSYDRLIELYVDSAVEHLDLLGRVSLEAVNTSESAEQCERHLKEVSDLVMREVRQRLGRNSNLTSARRIELNTRLQLHFSQRMAYWTAEALRRAREANAPEVKSSLRTVSAGVVKRRKERLQQYRQTHDLTAADFARRVGISQTAVLGIVKEDRKRFAFAAQARLLKMLGVSEDEWYQP